MDRVEEPSGHPPPDPRLVQSELAQLLHGNDAVLALRQSCDELSRFKWARLVAISATYLAHLASVAAGALPLGALRKRR